MYTMDTPYVNHEVFHGMLCGHGMTWSTM